MMILEHILEAAGVTTKRVGNEFYICCPFCGERGYSEDTRFRLGIEANKGLGHCFNCEWASGSPEWTIAELCRAFDVDRASVDVLRMPVPKPVLEPSVKPEPVGYPSEYEHFHLERNDEIQARAWQYLKSRRVSLAQIVRHKIGYAAVGRMKWRVLFPVLGEDGKVYGCVGRDFSGVQHPKYLNTPGIKMLWNGFRPGRTAVLVEGVLDALRVERAILCQRDWVAVARLGSALTELQVSQLRKFKRVIILPDYDSAGIKGVLTFAAECHLFSLPVAVVVPEELDGSDPGSMTEDRIVDCLASAQSWSQATEWRLRAKLQKENI